MARVSSRPSCLDKVLYPEGKGKNINATKIDDKKGNSTGFGRDDVTPAPYWIMTCLLPSAPPGPETALMPNPGPGEVQQPLLLRQLSPRS